MVITPVILAVDRNPRNLELLARMLGRHGFLTVSGSSLEEFDRLIAERDDFVVALVDIAGFDRRVWECCRRLRHRVPFLIVHRTPGAPMQTECLLRGAFASLVKPISVAVLVGMIRSVLELRG